MSRSEATYRNQLKCGNSLIGAKLNELGRYPQAKKGRGKTQTAKSQMSLTENLDFQRDIAEAIRGYLDIKRIDTSGREDVESKKDKLETIGSILRPYRELCELHTGVYFENELSEEDYSRLITGFQPDDWDALREKYDVAQALARTAGRRFFKWELEFPEVFFEEGGGKAKPGFDVVIGNPPYGAILTTHEKTYFQQVIPLGMFESFSLFISQFIHFICENGFLSYITPITLLYNTRLHNLRKYLLTNCQIDSIADFTGKRVFSEANVDTIVFVFERTKTKDSTTVIREKMDGEYRERFTIPQSNWQMTANFTFNISMAPKETSLFLKVSDGNLSKKLGEIVEFRTGVVTGDDKKFITMDKVNPEYKKLLLGKNIGRYSIAWEGLWLWYSPEEMKKTPIGRPREQWIFDADSKILLQSIRNPSLKRRLVGVLDTEQHYVSRHLVLILEKNASYQLLYILALLNSWFLNFLFAKQYTDVNIKPTQLKTLPIRLIHFTIPEKERELLVAHGKRLYAEGVASNVFDELLTLVQECLLSHPEKSDVVHDLLAFLAQQMLDLHKQSQSNDHSDIIHRTDELIDRIVYKLYGLTEEEINIVEGGMRNGL